jgi:hypothetical protein
MSRFFLPIFVLFTCLGSLQAASTNDALSSVMWHALSHPQQQELLSGKPVVLEEAVEGNAWPRYTVYFLVNSSAEQAAAVFWDCELDPKYVPNCLSVRITATPQPWIHEGEYTLRMPMLLPSEVYTSRNELKIPATGGYEIAWNVLHACYIKGSHGNIRIESAPPSGCHGDQTLIRYTNLVMPGSSIAGLLRSNARSQVIQSVKALVDQIEHEIQASPQLLQHQVQELEKALSALKRVPAAP